MPKIMRNNVEYGRLNVAKIMKNNIEYSGSGADSATLALPTPSEASGAIARFNTDLTENLLSAVAEFSASQASGTPTPSAPIPIVGVDKVNVIRTGKNLFNFDTVTAYNANVTVTKSNGDITVQNSNGYTLNALNGSEVYLKSGTYAISISEATTAAINIYKGGSWIASGISVGNTSGTFTITNSDTYNLTANVAGNSTITIKKLQIEVGTQPSNFETYNGTTVLINLGGTYYGGSVDAVTGKITLTHKKYVFDENLPQSLFGLTAVTGYTQLSYSPYINEGKANTVFLSDKFEFETGNVHSVYKCWNTTSVPRMFLALPDTVETKEDAISWFENNPTEVIAELATPLVVYASNTAEIPTINGFNQVFADTGDVAVKYFETVGHKI